MGMLLVFLVFFGFVFIMDLLLVAAVYTVIMKAKRRQEKKEVLEEIRRRKGEKDHAKDNYSDQKESVRIETTEHHTNSRGSAKQQPKRSGSKQRTE